MALLQIAVTEINSLASSPSEESPDVSSYDQIMVLMRNYTVETALSIGRDYVCIDKPRGLWKWKTRTVRIGGMYCGGNGRFVIAKAGFARGLKRGGRSVTEREAEFARATRERLREVGLLEHSWKTEDPHHGEAISFDPYT